MATLNGYSIKQPCLISRYSLAFTWRDEENHRKCQDNQGTVKDLHQVPLKYKLEALLLLSACWSYVIKEFKQNAINIYKHIKLLLNYF
jgi:hypothetical protein